MKKSKLRQIIRESIKELITEQPAGKRVRLQRCGNTGGGSGTFGDVCVPNSIKLGDMFNANPAISSNATDNWFVISDKGSKLTGHGQPCLPGVTPITINYMITDCPNCCHGSHLLSSGWQTVITGLIPQGTCTNPTINTGCPSNFIPGCHKCCCEDNGQGVCIPNTESLLDKYLLSPCNCMSQGLIECPLSQQPKGYIGFQLNTPVTSTSQSMVKPGPFGTDVEEPEDKFKTLNVKPIKPDYKKI